MPRGMNRQTGKELRGRDHLIQSLYVLLSTPIGSRVMRPEYGSELSDLLDSPITDATRFQINKAIFNAVAQWEPRFKLRQIQSTQNSEDGEITLTLIGTYEGQDITIDGLRPFTPLDPSTPIPEPPTIPEIPLDPSTPTGGDPRFTTLLLNDNALLVGDHTIGLEA